METHSAKVLEIILSPERQYQAKIECPSEVIPAPGQYIQAVRIEDENSPVPVTLFLGSIEIEEKSEGYSVFTSASPLPPSWQAGDRLMLRGTLGKGFSLPNNIQNIGLVASGDNITRLIPLAETALQANIEIALFADAPLPYLSPKIEANPMRELVDGLAWAQFLAIDLPLEDYERLPASLGLPADTPLPCPAQALVDTPMPCGGIANCGVCAVKYSQNKWFLACVDGPIVPIRGNWGK